MFRYRYLFTIASIQPHCLTSKTQTVYRMVQSSNNYPQQRPSVREGVVLALFSSPSSSHILPFALQHSLWPFFFWLPNGCLHVVTKDFWLCFSLVTV